MAAKAWTASGAPAAPISSDRARSNQTCACPEPFSSVDVGVTGLETSAGLADELAAAMAIAATQTLVAILIALSSPGDLDPSILGFRDARIGGDRQLGFAFGQ